MMPCYILAKWPSYHATLKPGYGAAFYKIVLKKLQKPSCTHACTAIVTITLCSGDSLAFAMMACISFKYCLTSGGIGLQHASTPCFSRGSMPHICNNMWFGNMYL